MVWCCRTSAVLVAVLMMGCGSSDGQVSASPSHPANPTPTQQLGPGGLTLDEEIGAVIMVGFEGPVTDSIKADWKQHSFPRPRQHHGELRNAAAADRREPRHPP